VGNITENAHKSNLKIPAQSWRSFYTDISASFDQPSIEGNNYQLAIRDNFTKFIWDYYLVTKDEAYDYIAMLLEVEININIATSEAIQPLKPIVDLFDIPDVDEVREAKRPAEKTVCKEDMAEEVQLQLVENQLPDQVEVNTNEDELRGQVKAVETTIDSGANRSMFVNESYLSDIKHLEVSIHTAGKVISSAGIGTVGLFKNCLYVPALKKNLLGVAHICNELHGAKAIFTKSQFMVLAPDMATLYPENRVNGLYKVLNLAWLGVMEV
jgi:hypothetical protein